MSRRGVFISFILFQVWITIVAFTSTSLATNPKSEVFPISHDKFASSIETNTTRNKSSVVQVKEGIEIKLTDLITRNVIKSFNQTKTKDHKEIKAHFQRIENEMAEQKEELIQFINRKIQTLGLSVGSVAQVIKIIERFSSIFVFTIRYFSKYFNPTQTREYREIIFHLFQRIENEMAEQKEELIQFINREIQTQGLSVGPVAQDIVGIALKLTDLITRNVKKYFNQTQTKEHNEKIAHFQRIENELAEQKEELQSINREIQTLGLSISYSQHEEKIKNSLLTLHQYLEHPDERHRHFFMDEASQLSKSLTAIVEGLLGRNVSNPDIMAVFQESIGCHGRRLHNKIKPIMSIIMTGLWVRGEYQRMRNVSEPDSSHFETFMMQSTTQLKNRLNDMAIECQLNEKNVVHEIVDIFKTKSSRNQKELAKSLLQFLEDKYDTKNWIVILLPDVKTTAENLHLELLSVNKVHFTQSGKFHTVSVQGTFVAAISVDPSAVDLIQFVDIYLDKFRIPIHTSVQSQRWDKRLILIHENLHLFLTPARKRAMIETLVIENPCTWSREKFEEMVTIVGSNGTEWRWKNEEFDYGYGKNGWCIDPLVIVVPVNSTTSSRDELDDSCENQDTDGLLRNEFSQAYLSVQGDSNQDGAYIILDRQWRNTSGQRWRFVNNQLMNDFGRCLTVASSSFLFQTSCNFSSTSYNKMRQTWRRIGLQIVNNDINNPLKAKPYNDLCLAFTGSKDDNTMYAVLEKCNFSPSFLWYDWDSNCEDVDLKDHYDATNGSRPLRNEFSRRYLSVYENEDYLYHRSWSNHPGQTWKFVDGQLRNNFGKCLMGKGWYVLQVECNGIGNSKRWTYNEKRQIVSAEGFCLSVGHQSGYIIYNHCKDDPEHRWY